MLVEITIQKSDKLPLAFDAALKEELEKRLFIRFSNISVRVKRGSMNNLTILRAGKDDKELINEILQETWQGADEWFSQDSFN